MKYAIIELAGKQYRVHEGYTFTVDKQDAEVGNKLQITEVLMAGDDEKSTKTSTTIGAPYISKAVVELEVVEQKRSKKLRVATYKSKSRYRRVKGHRQHQTTLTVTKLSV